MNKRILFVSVILIIIIAMSIVFLARDTDSENEQASNEPKIPIVGLLVPSDLAAQLLKAPLAELGYVEGDSILYTVAVATDPQTYDVAVQSLIDAKVDVIVSTGAPTTLAASNLTTTIPIVFMGNQGGFEADLVPLISQQGAETNLTGVITTNPSQRRFELMMEAVPSIKVAYFPYDTTNALATESLGLFEAAAENYGVTLVTHEFSDDAGGQQALDEIPENVDAILLGSEIALLSRIGEWADMSIRRQVPLVISLGQFTGGDFPAGILMGYGGGVQELYQQVADLIDQIIKGTKPADLPTRAADVYLTVSMGAAEALNIELPDSVLDQATQIIREEVPMPVAADATADASEAEVACNATLVSPLGENNVCITRSCGQLQDSGFVTYTDKVEVASCATEAVLGICSTEAADTFFYSGDVAPIESGCAANGGEWKISAE